MLTKAPGEGFLRENHVSHEAPPELPGCNAPGKGGTGNFARKSAQLTDRPARSFMTLAGMHFPRWENAFPAFRFSKGDTP
jgi:hypothetical protein